MHVTGGTGFTTGRDEVVSVSSGVATMDRSAGTGNLGGALRTVAGAVAAQGSVSEQTIWIKAGTYTITAAIDLSQGIKYKLFGYSAAHADWGTKPGIASSTVASCPDF
jgi:hypothetical protein